LVTGSRLLIGYIKCFFLYKIFIIDKVGCIWNKEKKLLEKVKIVFFYELNIFFVLQVSAKFGFSPSSKFLTNLVLHLSKCVNLVLLTKFC